MTPLRMPQKVSQNLVKSSQFCNFHCFFFFFYESVSVRVAIALFSWTKRLNYWIVVKQAPKIRFNFYNIKIDMCVFIFIKISQEYYHKISQINTANAGINPQTSFGSTALGLIPLFSVFVSYLWPKPIKDAIVYH